METNGDVGRNAGLTPDDSAMRALTLAELVRLTGGVITRLALGSDGDGVPITDVFLYDEHEGPPDEHGVLAVLVGVEPSAESVASVLRSLRGTTVMGVCLKSLSGDPALVARVAKETGIAVIEVAETLHWDRLYALFRAALRHSDHLAVSPQPTPTADLFSLANTLASALGCSVIIDDHEFRTLAYSDLSGSDELRRQSVLSREAPLEWFARFSESGGLNRIKRPGEIVRVPPFEGFTPAAAHARVAMGIRAGSELLGYLMIEESITVDATGEELIREAAKIAAMYILRDAAAGDLADAARDEATLELLRGVDGASDRLGIPTGWSIAVLAFGTLDGQLGPSSPLHRELRRICQLNFASRQHAHFCWWESTLLAVVAEPSGSHRISGLTQFADAVVRQAEARLHLALRVGTSDFGSVSAATSLRRDAVRALEVLSSHLSDRLTGTFADVQTTSVVLALLKAAEVDDTFTAGRLAELLESDAPRLNERALCLLTYLDHQGNVATAARELEMPANTLRYRVRTTLDTYGIDLEDAEQLVVAHLQLTLWRARRARRGDLSRKANVTR